MAEMRKHSSEPSLAEVLSVARKDAWAPLEVDQQKRVLERLERWLQSAPVVAAAQIAAEVDMPVHEKQFAIRILDLFDRTCR